MTLTNKTGNLVLPFYFLWLVSRFLPNKTLSFILGLLRWGLLRGVPAGFSFPRPKYKTAPAPLDCKTVRIFAYSSTREQSNKRSGTQLKTESETWGETLKIRTVRFAYFFLSPHTPYGRVRLPRFARVRLLRHYLPISLLILRKKTRLFCSLLLLQAGGHLSWGHYQPPSLLKGLSHAICFLFKKTKTFFPSLNSNIMAPTSFGIFKRLRYIVTTDSKNGHDWISKKSGNFFKF